MLKSTQRVWDQRYFKTKPVVTGVIVPGVPVGGIDVIGVPVGIDVTYVTGVPVGGMYVTYVVCIGVVASVKVTNIQIQFIKKNIFSKNIKS